MVRSRIIVDGVTRHVKATVGELERTPAGEPSRIVGVVVDTTDQSRAEQQIDAHLAVSEALAGWEGLEPGAYGLLRDLAGALMCAGGVLWTPEDGKLVARAVWGDPSVSAGPFWTAVRNAGLPRGTGVAGAAWQRGAPVLDHDGALLRASPLGPSAAEAGLGAGLAVPALCGDEVVAVVELPMEADGHITGPLMRSLVGIGHELGQFLARRRGQLGASRLTARELEVLQHTSHGLTTQQTADVLFLSAATVKTHLGHIYTKLGAADRAEAVANALRLGLIS